MMREQAIQYFRRLAKLLHPDKNQHPLAKEAFQKLSEAVQAVSATSGRAAACWFNNLPLSQRCLLSFKVSYATAAKLCNHESRLKIRCFVLPLWGQRSKKSFRIAMISSLWLYWRGFADWSISLGAQVKTASESFSRCNGCKVCAVVWLLRKFADD